MRRLFTILVLTAVAGGVCPAPAQAYFWDWIDSLSGPQYHGATIEWRVWCKTNRPTEVIAKLRAKVLQEAKQYEAGATANAFNARQSAAYRTASDSAARALGFIDLAMAAAERRSDADPRTFLVNAFQQRVYAARVAAWAEDPSPMVPLPVEPTDRVAGKSLFTGGASGLAVSLCDAGPYERHTRYLALNIAWGSDTKRVAPPVGVVPDPVSPNPDPANTNPDRNTMVSIGASYHAVVTPWLSLGLGGGLATFSSTTRPTFRRWYVEPYIVDVRPVRALTDVVGFFKRAPKGLVDDKMPSNNPLPDILYLRYGSVIFPDGFAPERFGDSPQFQAEFVRVYGVHADLEPVIRWLRKRY